MFWGLILRANKRYSQTVTKTFHLSQATLDVAQHTGDNDVQVSLTSDSENYILCTLSKKKNVLQVPLDLVFSEGDEISFSSNGVVHLTGYLIPNDEFDGFGGDEEELDEEEQEEEVPAKQLSKKELSLKKLMEEQLEDEDDSDSDFGEEAAEGEEEEDDDDDDEAEEDDDDDDDDEAESEEEEIVEPAPKKQKQANGLANGKLEQQKPVQPEQPKEKQLQGGVKVEDIRVGKGPEAKPGKKVQVYYEGRLKSNNKIFDSSKSGKGFSFNLGRGEVIRGWDLGVAGMKVGSKRRITCPPAMAYGAKGSPPVIPANATLVFDVELRGVK